MQCQAANVSHQWVSTVYAYAIFGKERQVKSPVVPLLFLAAEVLLSTIDVLT